MRKDQMVGTRLPAELVRDLETIVEAEQSDRSTTVRKLLCKAIRDWKLEHFARLYGDGNDPGTGYTRRRCFPLGNDGLRPTEEDPCPV